MTLRCYLGCWRSSQRRFELGADTIFRHHGRGIRNCDSRSFSRSLELLVRQEPTGIGPRNLVEPSIASALTRTRLFRMETPFDSLTLLDGK